MQVQYVYLIRTEPGKESALQVPSARKETIETMKICGFVEVPAADYARFLHEIEAIEAGGAK